jgi:hypothetical protein
MVRAVGGALRAHFIGSLGCGGGTFARRSTGITGGNQTIRTGADWKVVSAATVKPAQNPAAGSWLLAAEPAAATKN